MAEYIDTNTKIRVWDIVDGAPHFVNTTVAEFLVAHFDSTELTNGIPTADVKPVVHGHWIYGREIAREYLANECVAIEYEDISCSACKTRFRPFVGDFNYCPNCGTRMDENES